MRNEGILNDEKILFAELVKQSRILYTQCGQLLSLAQKSIQDADRARWVLHEIFNRLETIVQQSSDISIVNNQFYIDKFPLKGYIKQQFRHALNELSPQASQVVLRVIGLIEKYPKLKQYLKIVIPTPENRELIHKLLTKVTTCLTNHADLNTDTVIALAEQIPLAIVYWEHKNRITAREFVVLKIQQRKYREHLRQQLIEQLATPQPLANIVHTLPRIELFNHAYGLFEGILPIVGFLMIERESQYAMESYDLQTGNTLFGQLTLEHILRFYPDGYQFVYDITYGDWALIQYDEVSELLEEYGEDDLIAVVARPKEDLPDIPELRIPLRELKRKQLRKLKRFLEGE